jgi:hypothetical protein
LPEFGVFMRAALLLIAALSVVALPANAGAQDVLRREVAAPSRHPYYIEFRARTGGTLGHAPRPHGRSDGRGRIRTLRAMNDR